MKDAEETARSLKAAQEWFEAVKRLPITPSNVGIYRRAENRMLQAWDDAARPLPEELEAELLGMR